MKTSFSLLVTAAALLPFTVTSFVVTTTHASTPGRHSVSTTTTTSLGVSVEGTQLKAPRKVADLSETSEELYNQNVQTTYGYVRSHYCPPFDSEGETLMPLFRFCFYCFFCGTGLLVTILTSMSVLCLFWRHRITDLCLFCSVLNVIVVNSFILIFCVVLWLIP